MQQCRKHPLKLPIPVNVWTRLCAFAEHPENIWSTDFHVHLEGLSSGEWGPVLWLYSDIQNADVFAWAPALLSVWVQFKLLRCSIKKWWCPVCSIRLAKATSCYSLRRSLAFSVILHISRTWCTLRTCWFESLLSVKVKMNLHLPDPKYLIMGCSSPAAWADRYKSSIKLKWKEPSGSLTSYRLENS